jgi:hypothetical protein
LTRRSGCDRVARAQNHKRITFGGMRTMVWISVTLLYLWFSGACQAKTDVKVQWALAEYRVQRNDTLSLLSRKLGMSVNVLRVVNRLKTDRIRAGGILQFPRITVTIADASKVQEPESAAVPCHDTLVDHRLYAARNVFYLMVVVDDTEEYRNILVFRKSDTKWVELDHFTSPYPGIYRSKPKLIVKDLDQDGNDESFYFAEYTGSPKDHGVEGICHVPTLSENSLYGVEINIHAFNRVEQEFEGRPSLSARIEKLGKATGSGYVRYEAYLMKTAEKILGAEYTAIMERDTISGLTLDAEH